MLKPAADYIKHYLLLERERWVLWLPVIYGIGIYFSLHVEPPLFLGLALVALSAVAVIIFRNVIVVVIFVLVLGFSIARTSAEMAKAPVIYELDHAVKIFGNVSWISSESGFPKLYLENVDIPEIDQRFVPNEIELNVRTKIKTELKPGDRIVTAAKLKPPARPSIPGGYDLARKAYFEGTGAKGPAVWSVTKVQKGSEESWLENLRYSISNKIRASLPGDTGAMTDAVITGDRSRISKEAYNDMRNSGLAHLIAISGINLVLAAGVMFVGARFALSLFPRFSERYPAKKIAAILAIIGETMYLLISGIQVSAARSYIMVLLVMLAVVFDRAATPMRSVALSALIILTFTPASMLGPSFQMSYAATVALISVYEIFSRSKEKQEARMFTDYGKQRWHNGLLRKILTYPLVVLGTSLVAGMATAPYSAYHFNQFVNYGLLANMAAIPLTSFIVMPFAVVGMLLMPFGLQDIGLVPAGWGTYWTLVIAHYVGNLPDSYVMVPQIATWGLVAVTLGGLWVLIWNKKWRYWGLVFIFIGLVFSPLTVRKPDIIIHENGHLFAVNYQDKLYFSNFRKSRAAITWLKFFAQNEQLRLPKQEVYELGHYKLYTSSAHPALDAGSPQGDPGSSPGCAYRVVEDGNKEDVCITLEQLKSLGTHNIYLNNGGITVETVAERRGSRLWTQNISPDLDE